MKLFLRGLDLYGGAPYYEGMKNAKQENLFGALLNNTTSAFKAACVARDAFDFWAPEYLTHQASVDALYTQMQTLQDAVPGWWRAPL